MSAALKLNAFRPPVELTATESTLEAPPPCERSYPRVSTGPSVFWVGSVPGSQGSASSPESPVGLDPKLQPSAWILLSRAGIWAEVGCPVEVDSACRQHHCVVLTRESKFKGPVAARVAQL